MLYSWKADVIATVEVDYSEHRIVHFNAPDKYTPLLTKCEMYDKNNQCKHFSNGLFIVIMSTSVEDIDGMKTFWEAIRPYLVIAFLAFVIYYIWKNRNPFDPTLTMYGYVEITDG